jgi:HAE1 family hydrophobic/amphiphilic exporter-1
MSAYKVSVQEVEAAIRAQNIEAAPGKVGESVENEAQEMQYVLRYTGKFTTADEYKKIPIRALGDGSILRLGDVAEIELGSFSYGMDSKTDGRPSASIMIKQRPGSNASEVIASIKEKMAALKGTSFPPGMDYNISYDVSRFLNASIREVIKTLIEAFILVFIIVYLFLQDFRSTLIAGLAVPVALVGAFTFLFLLDFSINLLTLFALVLAIGIVVDDAIVVVEAVHAKMAEKRIPARQATIEAMEEISGAIIAITLVMAAVFIPVAFLSGPVGVFYRQFSLTLAFSIFISGINALTLTPALCAMWIKHSHGEHDHEEKKMNFLDRFFAKFNEKFTATENKYKFAVGKIVTRKSITFGVLGIFVLMAYGTSSILPTGFIPTEDQGMIYVNVTTPAGATLNRTSAVMDEISKVTMKHKTVETISTLAGYSLLTESAGASYGMGMINLKTWKERKEKVDDVIAYLVENTKHITDAKIEFFSPPTVSGFGNSSGFELRLQDRTGNPNLMRTSEVTKQFLKDLKARPEIADAITTFDASFPQYLIHFDYDLAAKRGVNVDNAMSALQTLFGSSYVSNFILFGQMTKVMVQAGPEYRKNPEDLLKVFVKNDKGEMVPLSAFVRTEKVFGPEQITRYNLYISAMITGEAASGYSSGDAIKAAAEVAATKLPKGYVTDWSGMTREEVLAGNQAAVIFVICLIFVYLLLSAQYESFLLPLAVLLSLPVGIFGALFFLKIAGLQNNIYAQVALVMLIGLLGKNAILIVEFAAQQRDAGVPLLEATVEGAKARLRPILMTSFAFVAGLIPLVIASGAGALGNRSIGTAAAGGMLVGTVFGVFIIPGLYYFFASFGKSRKVTEENEANSTH